MVLNHSALEIALEEDIEEVNKMIELHAQDNYDIMREQYISIKKELLIKLQKEREEANKLVIDFNTIANVTKDLRAFNHKIRQRIVKYLDENKQVNVSNIYKDLHLEQSVVSQHLAILRRANIVITKHEGRFIYYTLNYVHIANISNIMKEVVHEDGAEIDM